MMWEKKLRGVASPDARYLFSGTSGRWILGGDAEKAKDFLVSEGLVGHIIVHAGSPPTSISKGQWVRRDADGEFTVDNSFIVTTPAPKALWVGFADPDELGK